MFVNNPESALVVARACSRCCYAAKTVLAAVVGDAVPDVPKNRPHAAAVVTVAAEIIARKRVLAAPLIAPQILTADIVAPCAGVAAAAKDAAAAVAAAKPAPALGTRCRLCSSRGTGLSACSASHSAASS